MAAATASLRVTRVRAYCEGIHTVPAPGHPFVATQPTAGSGPPGGASGVARRCLNEALTGDEAALDRLLGHCWDSIVDYAASITGGVDSAEDVAQETFCRLWTRRSEFRAHGEASIGLIYRIARNLALNQQRARARRERHLSLFRDARPLPSDLHSELADQVELRAAAEAAIAALPPRRREVFTLGRFHGLTYAEIAQTMDISEQTVANQMSAALRSLRRTLERFLPLAPNPPTAFDGRTRSGSAAPRSSHKDAAAAAGGEG